MNARDLTIVTIFVAEGLASPGLAEDAGLNLRERIEYQLEIGGHELLGGIQAGPSFEASPFTTDGCSGGMSAGWEFVAQRFPDFRDLHQASPPWESCCVTHDHAYHDGGSGTSPEESFSARLSADKELRSCVSDWADMRTDELGEEYGLTPARVEMIYAAIANSMFLSVRMGGAPCTGLSWRWGYGWPDC